jgi:hypothetical protein
MIHSEEIQYTLTNIYNSDSYITTDDKIIISIKNPESNLIKYILDICYKHNISYTYKEEDEKIIINNDRRIKN